MVLGQNLGGLLTGWMGGADENDILGKSLVARRVSGGRVPEGCWGILIEPGGITQRFMAGATPAPAKDEVLFWVHPGSYDIEFAPNDSAPEVAVRLSIKVEFERRDILDQRFADFLARLDEKDLSVAALTDAVRDCAGSWLLPTAATEQELAAVRAGFSNRLRAAIGCCCLALERVDHGGQVDTAALLLAAAEAPALQPSDAVSTLAIPADSHAVRLLRPWREWRQRVAAADRIERLDAGLTRRLFLELPKLSLHLARHAAFDELPLFRRHSEVSGRLERLKTKTSFLPALKGSITAQPLPLSVRELRVAELERAAKALDELWVLAGDLPLPPTTKPADWLDELERLVANLEAAIQRRVGKTGLES